MIRVYNKKNDDKLFEARTMAEVEKILKAHNLPIVDVEEWYGDLHIYTEIRRKVGEHYLLKTQNDTIRRFEILKNGYLSEVSVFTGRSGRGHCVAYFEDLNGVEERGWELVEIIPEDLQIRTLAGCKGRVNMDEVETALHNYPYTF